MEKALKSIDIRLLCHISVKVKLFCFKGWTGLIKLFIALLKVLKHFYIFLYNLVHKIKNE